VIDTHAHVHAHAFDRDRAELLRRAWDSGLRFLIEVNISPQDWPRVRELAAGDPRIFATVGIHPHDSGRATLSELDALLGLIGDPKVRAIGETGLDYFRDYAPHDQQRAFFRRHIAAARETGLPLVVHSRAAHEDVLQILEQEGRGKVHGVLHCFSGDERIAEQANALGFLFGVGGAATYNPKRSASLLKSIGLDRIVLETDCPYLSPHPRRNDRNEPANIPIIAGAIAAYLEVEPGEVERVTDANAIRLFRLPQ
jgi:TatD DNase family protein